MLPGGSNHFLGGWGRTGAPTKPAEAGPGTSRGDLRVELGRNLLHGSDGPDSAAREIALFFDESQLFDYERDVDRWIFEDAS